MDANQKKDRLIKRYNAQYSSKMPAKAPMGPRGGRGRMMGKGNIILLAVLLIVFFWAACKVSGDESRREEERDA